jgi:hypothetical protein
VLAVVSALGGWGHVYLLHGRLGVERVDEDLGGVHARLMGDRLAGVLARTGELEGLGAGTTVSKGPGLVRQAGLTGGSWCSS